VKTLLIYAVVALVGPFLLLPGKLLAGFVFSLLLMFMPEKSRVPFCGFIGGLVGSALVILFAYFVFKWQFGPNSFNALPLMATVIPLIVPIRGDFKQYSQLSRSQRNMDPAAASLAAPTLWGVRAGIVGEIVGIVLLPTWLLVLGLTR
jgi:hypothetical protein